MNAFSWFPALVGVVVVFFEGLAAYREKTFAPFQKGCKAVKLFFIYHGGVVVGDLIILPYLFGIWMPYLSIPFWLYVVFAAISLFITWECHRAWWFMCENQPGFMYPDRIESQGDEALWYRDLPDSAWIHFVYMVGAIIMIGGYIFSPMSDEVIRRTSWAFIVFVPLAIIEPGIVQGWPPTKKDIINSVGSAIVLWAIVGLVTWAKLAHLQLHWHFINIML